MIKKNIFSEEIAARIVLSMVDLLTHVIFNSIYDSRFSPLWESSSPFFTPWRRKMSIRIVISMVDLLTHVIFTPIQQLSIFLSVENRSPRRRVVKIFQAYFKEFSTCLIDCKRIHHDIFLRSREKWGGMLSVVVVSDESTRVEHSS